MFSLPSNTNAEVLMIETAKENQPKLTKRWRTELNLTSQGEDLRSRNRHEAVSCSSYFEEKGYFVKQKSDRLTENAKKLSDEELYLLEFDIFKPLDFYEILFKRMKKKDEEICSKTPTLIRTFVDCKSALTYCTDGTKLTLHMLK